MSKRKHTLTAIKTRENGWITFHFEGSLMKIRKVTNRINMLWSHDDQVENFVKKYVKCIQM